MGADGGSIPDRRDLVRTKGKAEQTDRALLRELFFLCALSKKPLARPVVLDPLGKMYNKDSIIEYLLDRSKYGDGDQICGYIKGVKDLLTLNLTANPTYSSPSSSTTENVLTRAPFVCPLSLKEMSGAVPFVALRPCGCVFSDVSIRALVPTLTKGVAATVLPKDDLPEEAKPVVDGEKADVACPNCGNPFDPTLPTSIQPINPTREVQEDLFENLLIARAAAKSSSKKRKIVGITPSVPVTEEQPAKIPRNTSSPIPRTSSASPAPGMRDSPKLAPTSLARSVHQKLAEQEQKRLVAQAGMSDAVRAMFKPKEKGADHHKGNADFFGRTFTRYAA